MENMIDVTGVDLVKLAQAAYALSKPQGMGFLHFTPEPLSLTEAQALVDRERPEGHIALSMDYVHGRACKFSVFREDGKLWIRDKWFDHSDDQLKELCKIVAEIT